jgi:hypothetical protein
MELARERRLKNAKLAAIRAWKTSISVPPAAWTKV